MGLESMGLAHLGGDGWDGEWLGDGIGGSVLEGAAWAWADGKVGQEASEVAGGPLLLGWVAQLLLWAAYPVITGWEDAVGCC